MENGNTMIPPVAGTDGLRGANNAISIIQTTLKLQSVSFWNSELACQAGPVITISTAIHYFWLGAEKMIIDRLFIILEPLQPNSDFPGGIWSDLEQSICMSEEPIKKTFTAHFRSFIFVVSER